MLTFIELAPFASVRDRYLDDDEFARLQQYLVAHPDAGEVISGSGGCRKLRWSAPGRGRRGGVRVIYISALGIGTDRPGDDVCEECARGYRPHITQALEGGL